jgi:hypothetical protein
MQTRAKLGGILAAAACLALVACSSGGGKGGGGGGGGGGQAPPGTVNGMVTDIGTGARLEGVTVSGAAIATTDSKGEFTLTGVPAGSVILSFTKAGYAPGYTSVNATTAGDALLVRLKKQPGPQPYVPTAATTISQTTEAGPYALILAGNSLDTAAASVAVSITPLDPSKEREALPGSLVAGGASPSVLLPVTFAEFTLLDGAGNRVNLKSSASATVELPIPPSLRSAYPEGTKIHCYAYAPATGKWDDFVEGTVQKSSVDGTSPVLAAAIRHFSWYGGAPQGTNCADVYVHVVSAVDGRPLGNARVEASPGTTSYTDASGDAVVVAGIGNTSSTFTAYQTGFDVDGSLTGIPGAKYIEFGKVEEDLVGLVPRSCTGAGSVLPAVAGAPGDRLVIRVGVVKNLLYDAFAILSAASGGSVTVFLQQGVPGPSGELDNPLPATGAKIYLADAAGTSGLLTDAGSGTYYLLGGSPAVTAGKQYTLSIDADGNGSIDGSATAFAVGELAWVNPTDGATVAGAGLDVSWSDSGTASAGPAYAPVYQVTLAEGSGADFASYIGTDRHFAAESSLTPGAPLAPGTYTGNLVGFSGAYSAGGGFQLPNNITGSNVTGVFFSVGSSAAGITFTVQ